MMPASPFMSSDGRTDEALAREVSGVVGGESREPQALRSQTGVGSERSSPSETDLYELLTVADSRFRLNVRDFVEALEEPPLFLRRAG